MNIYRKLENGIWRYTIENDPVWVGTSKTTCESFFQYMTVQSNQGNSLCLRKENLFLQLLAALPVIGWFVLVPFYIYENGICIGRSRAIFNTPVYTFQMRDDVYELSLHKRDKASLLKNGKQIALYQRMTNSYAKKAAYSVLHILGVEKEILLLFSVFVDRICFFTGDYQWKKVVPLDDKHPERGDWKPPENEEERQDNDVDQKELAHR